MQDKILEAVLKLLTKIVDCVCHKTDPPAQPPADNIIKHKKVVVSKEELLHLSTTRKLLLANPDPSKMAYPLFITARLTGGTVPYAFQGGVLSFDIGSLRICNFNSTAIDGQLETTNFANCPETPFGLAGQQTNSMQGDLTLHATNVNPTGGDGKLIIDILYFEAQY